MKWEINKQLTAGSGLYLLSKQYFLSGLNKMNFIHPKKEEQQS